MGNLGLMIPLWWSHLWGTALPCLVLRHCRGHRPSHSHDLGRPLVEGYSRYTFVYFCFICSQKMVPSCFILFWKKACQYFWCVARACGCANFRNPLICRRQCAHMFKKGSWPSPRLLTGKHWGLLGEGLLWHSSDLQWLQVARFRRSGWCSNSKIPKINRSKRILL